MRHRGVQADAVLTSPLLRARQTAEIVARALGISPHAVEDLEELACGAAWVDIRHALQGRGRLASVILVGHMPDLSRIAADLLSSKGQPIEFRPGSLARLEVDGIPPRSPAMLDWVLSLEDLGADVPR